MTEERRRSTDRVLDVLLEQQKDNHAENQRDIRELTALVRQAMGAQIGHGMRLDILEGWRKDHVDPSLRTFHEGVSQAKGAGKLMKMVYAAGLVGGGGAAATWGGKILAAIFSAAPK